MPGRNYTLKEYRYGMNGQEKDDALIPGGYSAMYWGFDARLGRRWNLDPVVDESISPYATFDNNPIALNDPDGDCPWCIVFAIVEGGAELVSQTLIDGKSLSEVDWADVGAAAVEGAVDGSGLGLLAKVAVKGVTTIVKSGFDVSVKSGNKNVFNGKVTIEEFASDAFANLVADYTVSKIFDKLGGGVGKQKIKEAVLKKMNADKVYKAALQKSYKQHATKAQKNAATVMTKKVTEIKRSLVVKTTINVGVSTVKNTVTNTYTDKIKAGIKVVTNKPSEPPPFNAPFVRRERDLTPIRCPKF